MAEMVADEREIRAQLQAVLDSEQFVTARKLRAFLEFAVTSKLGGLEVKESLIAVEVYGREGTYNPKTDSIVRAEASRLRAKLREYYDGPGRSAPVLIDLPKGSYVPVFTPRPVATATEPAATRKLDRRWVLLLGGVVVAAVVLALTLSWKAPAPSIAVTPLKPLVADPNLQVVADSLGSHLTQALLVSRFWKVTRGEAGRQNAVLSGSLRQLGNRDVRLTLELVNPSDGYLLWRNTYDHPLQAMADTQAETARSAVAALTERYLGRPETPPNPEYEQARQFWRTYTPSGLERSLPHFRRALEKDPKLAAAWAGIADASIRLSEETGELDNSAQVEAARAAALQALRLDDANAEAHAVLGRILLYRDWNFRASVEQFQRAVALDPTRVGPQISYAQALSLTGDLQGALDAIREAEGRLPALPDVLMQRGSILFLARQFEKMEATGREMLALDADSPSAYWLIGLSLEQRGRVVEAIQEFEKGLRAGARKDLRLLCALSHSYGLRGDRARAFELQRQYLPKPDAPLNRFTLSYCAALTHIGLGDREGASRWLEKARQMHDNSLPFLPFDPRFDRWRARERSASATEWRRTFDD